MFPQTEREFVVQETVMTKIGVDRVLKYAFDLAKKTKKNTLHQRQNLMAFLLQCLIGMKGLKK